MGRLSFLKKCLSIFATVALLITSLQLSSWWDFPAAEAALSNVVGVDQSTSSPGVSGADVTVTWTVGAAVTGFQNTKVFVVANAVSNADALLTTPLAVIPDFFQSMVTLPNAQTVNSSGTTWAASTDYKACVLQEAASSANNASACSAAFQLTSDTVTDTMAPFVDHSPVRRAIGGQNAYLYAKIMDDQTTAEMFDVAGGNEQFELHIGTDLSASDVSPIDASDASAASILAGNVFEFIVPSNRVPAAGNSFEYYFKGRDRASAENDFYICPQNASTQSACQTTAFVVNTITAGAISVSGTVSSGGAGLASARVWSPDFAFQAVTAGSGGSAGQFTINNFPANFGFIELVSGLTNYCEGHNGNVNVLSGNVTGANFNMSSGSCNFAPTGGGAPGGSGGGAPQVVFTGPPSGSQGVPPSEKIRVGFNQTMNPSTINDSNAVNAGSNIYLTSDSGDLDGPNNDGQNAGTRVAGSVVYCSAYSATGGCSNLFPMDTNVVVFLPSADLTTNTGYTLVIADAVSNESGQTLGGSGYQLSFFTSGGTFNSNTLGTFGSSGGFGFSGATMPPYVKAVQPSRTSGAPNANIMIEFNTRMSSASLTPSNILLYNVTSGTPVPVSLAAETITLDNSEQRFVTINPASNLTVGTYRLVLQGAIANSSGVGLRPPDAAAQEAFRAEFSIAGSADTTPPSIFPMIATGTSSVSLSEGRFEFGAKEAWNVSTITTSNITMTRGSTNVSLALSVDPSTNSVYVVPEEALRSGTSYTITFGTGVQDLNGVALPSATEGRTFTYTTATSADTTQPRVKSATCDDYACVIEFTEPVQHGTQTSSSFSSSIVNHANISLTQAGVNSGSDVVGASSVITYDAATFTARIEGLSLNRLPDAPNFVLTVTGVTDMATNALVTSSSANVVTAKVLDSKQTFGNLGSMGGSMFPPPVAGLSTGGAGELGGIGGTFNATARGDFGTKTPDQFMQGNVDMCFPFNQMAGQNVNVFHCELSPGIALTNDDQVKLTFPRGFTVANAAPDTNSPFRQDMNQFDAGTVIFDTDYSSDGVLGSSSDNTVTVQLGVTGTPTSSGRYTIDLKGILNSAIPKGPESSGYTIAVSYLRAGASIGSATTQSFFVQEAGAYSITANVCVGACSGESKVTGANGTGTVRLFVGGPNGGNDKIVTLTDGLVSAVDGTSATEIALTGLMSGCYFIGTEPSVTIGSADYFGSLSPEPLCVNAGQTSLTKSIIFTATSGSNSHTLNLAFSGINFNSADVDVFGGGPGKFVKKTLADMGNATSSPITSTIKLNDNGEWFVGMGPAMGGSGQGRSMDASSIQFPPPANLRLSGLGGTPVLTLGRQPLPPGVTFNDTTDTLTFTFATADRAVTGKVDDGTTGLSGINVSLRREGFGAPIFTTTDSSGNFSANVNNGKYEVEAFSTYGRVATTIDVKASSIIYKGKAVSNSNPLILSIKKPNYTITGKVYNSDSTSTLNFVPMNAVNAGGEALFTMSGSDGSYSLPVSSGVWTITGQLPPDQTSSCGGLSLSVTIASESKANQNLTLSTGTCYTLSGTVTFGDATQASVPVFIQQWDTVNNRPSAGGTHRGTSTNSSGLFTTTVAPGTYRVGTWSPDWGELNATATVTNANVTNAHLNSGATGIITFDFVGGTSGMDALVKLTKADDVNTSYVFTDADPSTDETATVPAGTYNYSVNVEGGGIKTGTVATGAPTTVSLSDLSFVTVTGTVKDDNNTALVGVNVTATDPDTGLTKTAVTGSDGTYSLSMTADTYTVSAALDGYIPSQAPEDQSFASNTSNYDFGGASPDQTGLTQADTTISGIITQSDATTPVTDGYVVATNSSTGVTASAPIDPTDGSYVLPVVDGIWTIEAVAPLADETVRAGTVTVGAADVSGVSISVASNAANIPESSSSSIPADLGGVYNDFDDTGMKITAAPGVLEASTADVTLDLEKTFTAPDTTAFEPLSDVAFNITASGNIEDITDLSGTAFLEFDYGSMVSDLPSTVTESQLQLVYLNESTNEYVPVEGGFTIDTTNNKITAATDHFTTFAIVYSTSLSSTSNSVATTAAAPSRVQETTTTSSTSAPLPPTGGGTGVTSSQTTTSAPATTTPATTKAAEAKTEAVAEKKVSDIAYRLVPEADISGGVREAVTSEFSKPDVAASNGWAQPYVEQLMEKGVVQGYDDGLFHPERSLNRAEFAKMVVEAFDLDVMSAGTAPFKDVAADQWYAKYVYTLQLYGVVKGYSDGTYRPSAVVSRAEALKMILVASGVEVGVADRASVTVSDVDSSQWYFDYVAYALAKGIMSGYADGSFGPADSLTRGQVAKILVNALVAVGVTGR